MRALHVLEVFVERGKQIFKQMSPDGDYDSKWAAQGGGKELRR